MEQPSEIQYADFSVFHEDKQNAYCENQMQQAKIVEDAANEHNQKSAAMLPANRAMPGCATR